MRILEILGEAAENSEALSFKEIVDVLEYVSSSTFDPKEKFWKELGRALILQMSLRGTREERVKLYKKALADLEAEKLVCSRDDYYWLAEATPES